MDLELLHKAVFVIMGIVFIVSNYVIIYKFIQISKIKNQVGKVSEKEAYKLITKLKSSMWILDFGVTSGPLLGLLGSILALIESFANLASRGISNPVVISKSIGFALVATAFGICLALWDLVFYKMLNDMIRNIKDEAKLIFAGGN
ncbi:MotA/TolQ/ExbB proton channel family protein [Hydrogenobaculum acidophilum]